MARKKEPYMVWQTKEEFDKFWDEKIEKIRSEARADGFKDGAIWVVSYVKELFQDMFKPDTLGRVEEEIRHRQIEQWRRTGEHRTLKGKLDMRDQTRWDDDSD